LRQVLINLVNNAIKFTDDGSVNLKVFKLADSPDDRPVIRFEIRDTGIGIPEESLPTIFEDFTQAKQSSNRSYGGTGLGTTISKELVELMGGEIGVESELNQGSMFWCELPFEAAPYNDLAISDNHILLLSSDETAEIVRPHLQSWNIEFDWVRSPTRALSLLLQGVEQGKPYHSVIVDQECLTDINAEQFAQMVRTESLLENLSLILVNSSDTMIDINSTNFWYISTIIDLGDKRPLFNAIHAAQSLGESDDNVVTLAEHYGKLAGEKSLNILVAEDNSVNQQVIQGILRHAGHNVQIRDSGEAILDILEQDIDSVDMLILDMNMPELSGIDIVKTVRFMDASHSLPVIMLTADATPEAREASMEAGANAFLTKPVDARALLERIANLSQGVSGRIRRVSSSPVAEAEVDTADKAGWYDETVLSELMELGDEQFIKTLVTNFQRDGEKALGRINASLDDDYPEFREALHALKGSSIEIGATRLHDVCRQGEALKPYDIGTEKCKKIAAEIERVFGSTSAALSNVTRQDMAGS
jgi:two-component system sensor histidine kinase RpfC